MHVFIPMGDLHITFLPYPGEGVILDRSVFGDCVFANVCTKEGYISAEGQAVNGQSPGFFSLIAHCIYCTRAVKCQGMSLKDIQGRQYI